VSLPHGSYWKSHKECGATARLTIHGDFPGVCFNEPFGDRQPQARPVTLRRVERAKERAMLLARHTGTVVSHCDTDRGFAANGPKGIADFDLDRVPTRLQGILQENSEYVPDCQRVNLTVQVQIAAVLPKTHRSLFSRQRQLLPRFPHDLTQMTQLAVQSERGGVCTDLFVQSPQILLGLLDIGNQFDGLG
jgi:hypothetical protein